MLPFTAGLNGYEAVKVALNLPPRMTSSAVFYYKLLLTPSKPTLVLAMFPEIVDDMLRAKKTRLEVCRNIYLIVSQSRTIDGSEMICTLYGRR